jgi:hypothetical protein
VYFTPIFVRRFALLLLAFAFIVNMASSLLLAASLAAACLLPAVEARVNASGAIQVFWISECDECTADKNSIFCSEAVGADLDNYVSNGTLKVTIADKKVSLGAAKGAKFCWKGAEALHTRVYHFFNIPSHQATHLLVLSTIFMQLQVLLVKCWTAMAILRIYWAVQASL